MADGLRLLPPLLIRLHEDDHERYGAGPWRYDEAALLRLPYGELVAIEAAIGMSLTRLMYRMRQDYVDARRAAVWIARRMAGISEPLDTLEPVVTLMTVEVAGDDADPPAPAPSSSSSTDPSPASATPGSPGSPSSHASRRATSRR